MLDASDGVGTDGFIVPEMAAAGLTTLARGRANSGYANSEMPGSSGDGIQRCRSGS